MGRGRNKQKNTLKKAYLAQAVKYIEKLEAENKSLKEDPNTMIGQFIGQFRELYGQNSRLSVLTAVLLQRLQTDGAKVLVTKEQLDQFKGNRINIKWEIPENVEKPEDATEYIFSYELQPEPEAQPQQVQATQTPMPPCTDPECNLPKDFPHTHTAAPDVVVNGDMVVAQDSSGELVLENAQDASEELSQGQQVTSVLATE